MPTSDYPSDSRLKVKRGKEKRKHPEVIEDWTWLTIADSSSRARPAIFTADGKYFFSIVGASVRIYSVVTGKVVSTLSSSSSGSSASRITNAEGHADIITAAVLNPVNPFQLVTASLDGNIKVWDFLDAALLQTIRIGKPISHMCMHEKFKDKVFIAVLTEVKRNKEANVCPDKGNAVIYRVSLTPKGMSDFRASKPCEVIRIGKSKAVVAMAISPSGSWLVVISGHKAYVSLTASPEMGFTKFVSQEKLTCLAFHPMEDYFATGDTLGQLRVWYCLNNQLTFGASAKKRGQTTTLHWHAHAVSSLTFTPNGAYILSGGEESVLVIWQLHTGKREFVPRLGSPISSITVRPAKESEEEYLVGLSDGSYVFINSGSLSIVHRIARVTFDANNHSPSNSAALPLAVHTKSSTIILPASHPSCLQLYSLDGGNVYSELDIAPSNRVSRQDDKVMEFSRVENISIDSSGLWMASIDRRQNADDFSAETSLKIWRWESSTWTLNTRIDRPHGSERVIALDFSPAVNTNDSLLLMTAGQDGQVKTWCFRSMPNKKGESDGYWISRSGFSYRGEKPVHASWSPDASLLAVCHDQSLALYDPRSSLLVDYLVTSDIRDMNSIHFVGRSGRYLLATAKRSAVLWDLVMSKVAWNYRSSADIACVLTHPMDDLVTFIVPSAADGSSARTSQVLNFRPSSSKPFSTTTFPFCFRAVTWFSIYDASSHSFIGITYDGRIVLCGRDALNLDNAHGQDIHSPREIVPPTSQVQRRSLFGDMFGNSAIPEVPSANASEAAFATLASSRQRPQVAMRAHALSPFDTPAYLCPPIESLYSTLMESCLVEIPDRKDPADEVLEARENFDANRMEIDLVQTQEAPAYLPMGRTVGDSEMEELVALFQSQITSKSPIHNKVNGMSNGTHHGKGASQLKSIDAESRPRSVSPHIEAASSPSISQSPPRNHAPRLEKSPAANGIGSSHGHSPSSYSPMLSATVASPIVAGKKRKKK